MDSQTELGLRCRDRDAIQDWVSEHYDDIYRFLRHLSKSRETAEDLTQQTFFHALEAVSRFEGRSAIRTWLHKIAFREYLGWRRKQRWLAPLDALIPSKDRHMSSVEDSEVLLSALHKLSAPLREAFLMHEVQQLSIEEIAVISDCAEGTVKWRLHEARAELRRMLSSTFQEVIYES
jgi:RNA polymerase sigma factor (sigma-70 family)